MVMSGLEVSFIEITVLVAGYTMPIRIRNGMIAHAISTLTFSWFHYLFYYLF